jgi:hypothetical protein
MGSYIRPISGQCLRKYSNCNVGNRVLSARSAPRIYKEGNWGNQLSYAREAEKRWRYSWVVSWQEFCIKGSKDRAWACEAEESPLLVAVTRKWLVKTQAGKALAGAGVICELWILAVALYFRVVCMRSINPFTNPYPVYSHTLKIVTVSSTLYKQSSC